MDWLIDCYLYRHNWTYYRWHDDGKIGTDGLSKFGGGRIYQFVDEIFCVCQRVFVLW